MEVTKVDVIDRLLGLKPGDALYSLRHARQKVVEATQAFHELAFFSGELSPSQRQDRLFAAAITAQQTGPAVLADEYRQRLLETSPPTQYLSLLEPTHAHSVNNPALAAQARGQQAEAMDRSASLQALAQYARTLALRPATADRDALLTVTAAGWSVPEVVSLAQIMGYVSYQARMMIGLLAIGHLSQNAAQASEPEADKNFVHPAHLPAPGERLDINGFTNATLGWQAWLPIQDIHTLTDAQSSILDTSHPTARESDYYMLLVRAPELLEQRSLVYNAIMYAPGGAARHERELASAAVSRFNGCVYCTSVHAQRFEQLAKRNDVIAQLFENPLTAGTNARERAIVQTAIALTDAPERFDVKNLQALTTQGMTAEEIRDILCSVAIFAWANRLMMNLGEHVMPAAA